VSTPSSSSEDRVEQETPAVRAAGEQVEVPLEAGAADVAEQAADAGPPASSPRADVPLEVDPADAAEQSAVVELDEDERR
jgi:hypothetical protein